MITIEKAIEVLKELKIHPVHKGNLYHKDAVNLGIEALKLLSQQPPHGYTCVPRPLPGETEE